MRTKNNRFSKKRRTTITIKRKIAKRKYKGGNYAIEQLRQVPTDKYIPFGGESYNHFDYPNLAEGVGMQTYNNKSIGGSRRRRSRYQKKGIKRKGGYSYKKVKGGGLMAVIPQQIINTGRGVSGFFSDKVNSYQGYPLESSYLPYAQPIDKLNNSELISLY